MDSTEHEQRGITQYVELETDDETVTHIERVAVQRVLGERHEIWDVHTDQHRWWVITNMTNLYSQDDFKTMDTALSFHIGLMARIVERQRKDAPEEETVRLASAWRRFGQAVDAFNAADEAEEFQAVAMRCRETLIAVAKDVADDSYVPDGTQAPKLADFVRWTEIVVDAIAEGPRNARVRTYLKSAAKTAWELVQWLTHDSEASRYDAELALDATQGVISALGMAIVRHEKGSPHRCPSCGSYKLFSDYRPETNDESPYVTVCTVCAWEDEA